jgi:hypothetical protein
MSHHAWPKKKLLVIGLGKGFLEYGLKAEATKAQKQTNEITSNYKSFFTAKETK